MKASAVLIGLLAAASLAVDAAVACWAQRGGDAAPALLASLVGSQVGLVAWWASQGGAVRWTVAAGACWFGGAIAAPVSAYRDDWTLAFAAAAATIVAAARAFDTATARHECNVAGAQPRLSYILIWAGSVAVLGWLLATVDAGRVAWSEVAVIALAVASTTLAAAFGALAPKRTDLAAVYSVALPFVAVAVCVSTGRTAAETMAACCWLMCGLAMFVVRVSRDADRHAASQTSETVATVAAEAG